MDLHFGPDHICEMDITNSVETTTISDQLRLRPYAMGRAASRAIGSALPRKLPAFAGRPVRSAGVQDYIGSCASTFGALLHFQRPSTALPPILPDPGLERDMPAFPCSNSSGIPSTSVAMTAQPASRASDKTRGAGSACDGNTKMSAPSRKGNGSSWAPRNVTALPHGMDFARFT